MYRIWTDSVSKLNLRTFQSLHPSVKTFNRRPGFSKKEENRSNNGENYCKQGEIKAGKNILPTKVPSGFQVKVLDTKHYYSDQATQSWNWNIPVKFLNIRTPDKMM